MGGGGVVVLYLAGKIVTTTGVVVGLSSLLISVGKYVIFLLGALLITEVGGKGVVVGRICFVASVVVVCGFFFLAGFGGVFLFSSNGAKKFGGGGSMMPGTKGPGGTSVELSFGKKKL